MIEESEAALRAGIDVSSATMARVNSAKSSRRRMEILASRRLMHRMGISDHNVFYLPQGKPMMRNGMHISVSHSHGQVCIAVSDYPIGIDTQLINHKIRKVFSWFAHPGERKEERRNDILRMALLWSAKEALYKVEGDAGYSLRDFHVRLPHSVERSGYFPAVLQIKGKKTKSYRLYYYHDEKYVTVHAISVTSRVE